MFSIVKFVIECFKYAPVAFETGFWGSLFILYFLIIVYVIILVLINRELSIDNY